VLDWNDSATRARVIKMLTVALPPLWALFFLFVQSPVVMVQIGGVAGGIFLVAVVIAVWRLRGTEVDPRFRANRALNGALVLSSVSICLLGVYSILDVFGVISGS
jgi:hypothetical protein